MFNEQYCSLSTAAASLPSQGQKSGRSVGGEMGNARRWLAEMSNIEQRADDQRRKLGLIHIEINSSLLDAVLHDRPELKEDE
jgi:hypothetical protein